MTQVGVVFGPSRKKMMEREKSEERSREITVVLVGLIREKGEEMVYVERWEEE